MKKEILIFTICFIFFQKAYSQNAVGQISKAIVDARNMSQALSTLSTALNIKGATEASKSAATTTAATTAASNPVTAGTAPPLFTKAQKELILSGVLYAAGLIAQNQSQSLAEQEQFLCKERNKIATKPEDCINVVSTSDLKPLNNQNKSSKVSEWINSSTGQCLQNAPSQCQQLVKNAPAGCFKSGGSCMASILKNENQKAKLTPDGKASLKIDGKEVSFSLADLKSEESMINAGFSPALAKDFFSNFKDTGSLIEKTLVDAQKTNSTLNLGANSGYAAINYNSRSSYSSSGSSGSTSNLKKDEYVPSAEAQLLLNGQRIPSSSELESVEFNGNKIGAGLDDLFNMINRRYNLKQQQNIFIEE